MRASRRVGTGVATAAILSTVLVVAGCSSTDEGSSAGSAAEASGLTTNTQVACDRYYALDLFRLSEVERSEDVDEAGRVQMLVEYRDLASSMLSGVESAVTVGGMPARAQVNAARILKQLTRISSAGGDIWDLSQAVEQRIAKSSARIEALCVAADQPVPQPLLDAREGSFSG